MTVQTRDRSASPEYGRRRADADEDELGAVDRLADVERERAAARVPRDQLVEAGLVDRHLAAPQRVDPLGDDVADDHRVAELGEAGAGDEADVAGAEDPRSVAISGGG